MIRVEDQRHRRRVHVSGEMTIYSSAQLHDALVPLLGDERELELCLDQVGEIDSAGIQLLMLMQRERQRRELGFRVCDTGPAVREVFELFNLDARLCATQGERHGA